MLKKWLSITAGSVFWIAAIQVAWTIALILWILTAVEWTRRFPQEGYSRLVWGILLSALMLMGVIVVVIHLARQVAHNRAVKDFISQVSHDLRSPLATIKLHLQTIEQNPLSLDQQKQCLDIALQETERLETSIEGILTASRLERSRLKVATEPVDLKAFLNQYATLKSKELELLGASLKYDLPLPLMVAVDPLLLKRMLDNLVENALVHCQEGVHIKLSLHEQGGCAVMGVTDDGPGLPRHECRKVFRMFYRMPREGKGRKGTGLGLFIVRGLAVAHGGRAWVESPGVGKGCSFRVALPIYGGVDHD